MRKDTFFYEKKQKEIARKRNAEQGKNKQIIPIKQNSQLQGKSEYVDTDDEINQHIMEHAKNWANMISPERKRLRRLRRQQNSYEDDSSDDEQDLKVQHRDLKQKRRKLVKVTEKKHRGEETSLNARK